MRLLVLLELGADTRIPPECDPRSGRLRMERLVRETDPGSARSLELALRVKAVRPGVEVTTVHLGRPDAEPWLRHTLARGCDRAVRIWGEGAAGVHAAGKAVILTAAAQALGFDLILTGDRGVMHGGGQLGVLVAAHLDVPCVTQVIDIEVGEAERGLVLRRGLDRGFVERVEAFSPFVVTVSSDAQADGGAPSAVVPISALLAARVARIPVWDLADLGVPSDRVRDAERRLRHGLPRPRRPRLFPLEAPDPALPTFDRILKLVEGTVRRRQGRVIRKTADEVVEHIFTTLVDEGWLDHVKSGGVPEAPTGEGAAAPVNTPPTRGPQASVRGPGDALV